MNRAARLCVLMGAVIFFTATAMVAQFTTASLGGVVSDSSGAVIPGAKLSLTNQQTGLSRTATSDAQGHYLFPALPVGHYELFVEKGGFTSYKQTGIELTVNQSATQNVSLKVGQVNQEVTVGANVELVNTREATVGQLIDERRIVDLPLDGRNAADLALLGAGTVNVSSINTYCDVNCEGGTHPGERRINVNGIGPNAVNYQLDGASHNDTYINTNLPFPNPDAVQEFTIQSDNLSAEYGNAAAGAINVITKSGTNQFHGDVFEFLRNGALNANNYFANQSTPVQKDVLKRNQFGGSVGGPIVKNKLFFFGTYQGTRLRSAGAGNVAFVPTQTERNGDFSALCGSFDGSGNCTNPSGIQLTDPTKGNTKLPFNRLPGINPVAQFFLQQIPLPNGGGNTLNYLGPRQVQNEDEFMGKLDYSIGQNQRLSGHYFQTYFRQPPATAQQNLLAADSNGNHVRVQNVAINHTYSKSPTLLFNTWFGWELQTGGSLSGAPFGLADAGMNVAQTKPAELSVFVNNYFSINTNHNGDFDRGDITVRENITLVHNRHELHFGGEVVRLKNHLRNEYLQNANIGTQNALSG
ncbi:MAG TPA: TonB-dependent receptor, partial [Candidatus Binatia bacterium]|nr:TonB-dependent receptor [Candidatus Binatia bacterium]